MYLFSYISTYTYTYVKYMYIYMYFSYLTGVVTLIISVGKEHLKLIFEYAEWVLKEHQEDGLKVCGLNKEEKIT